jgi:hypothetical protein
MKKNLLHRIAKIVSDNENYDNYRDKDLQIIHVAYSVKEHLGYDSSMEGQALCDFKVLGTGKSVPFSLYEHEFELL